MEQIRAVVVMWYIRTIVSFTKRRQNGNHRVEWWVVVDVRLVEETRNILLSRSAVLIHSPRQKTDTNK